MPEICRFKGIRITMYAGTREHPPPHFHARHGDLKAAIDIRTGRMIEGSLPASALKLVSQWCVLHRAELEENWRLARAERELNPIAPL
ncbi:MAG: DUF4160 domain-containing protein [Verrucomicrobiaceae bacterium]|nr:DUF4160 domain-containing protein [Verrucomicrobiaceae bacterium]